MARRGTSWGRKQEMLRRLPLYFRPVAWLRADLGITLNGSNVSAWADQSGKKNGFTQGTAANQPLYVSNGINSRPILRFDNTDDLLTSSSAASTWKFLHDGTGATLATAHKFSGGVGGTGYMYETDNASASTVGFDIAYLDGSPNGQIRWRISNGSGTFAFSATGALVIPSGGWSYTVFRSQDGEAVENELRINGTQDIAAAFTGAPSAANPGATLDLASPSDPWPSDWAEIIAYNRYLALSEIKQIEMYFRSWYKRS